MCEKMQKAFEKYFPTDIQFPQDSYAIKSPGAIAVERWTIKYIFGEDSGRAFIEFYSVNPFAGDLRARVYIDGTCEESDDVIQAWRQPDAERKRIEHELKTVGLWPYAGD